MRSLLSPRRWAPVWEEVEESVETARGIRDDLEEWLRVSFQEEISELSGRFLERTKEWAR